jgi:hypothetical protein
MGLLQPQQPEANRSFIRRHAKGIADASGHVLDRCMPVAVAEDLPRHVVEAVGFVAFEIVDEEFVTEIASHQSVRSCPRPH